MADQERPPNDLYWAFNVPLQIWPADDGSDSMVLNYMPRRRRCAEESLNDLLGEQSRDEFLNTAADKLENLAKLMRAAAKDPTLHVYYHDAEVPTND